jgi:uncharacterized repeat protein (TIGR01451 family)
MIRYLKKLNPAKWIVLLLSMAAPGLVLANPHIQILGESTTNPSLGSTMYVTVAFCDDTSYANNRVKLMAAIISGSGQTSLASNCSTAGQYLVVDSNIAGSIATGPGQYDQTSGTSGVSGPPVYPSYTNGAGTSCPANGSVTAVWPIYIDGSSLSAGSYSFVAQGAEDYTTCGNYQSADHFNFTVPYPPANLSLIKIADGTSPNDGNLVLFRIDYTYGNTGAVTITDTIPANVSLVTPTSSAISPGGTLSGSTITWILPASLPTSTGEVWFLTKVNAAVPAGTAITNQASAASAATGSVTSNVAQANVGEAGFTLTKSETPNNPTLNPGGIITYGLTYQISGLNLQLYDSYDNVGTGTTNAGTQGYDGTSYDYNTTGGTGTFTTQSDGQGNHYINAYTGTGINGNYPALLRHSPDISLCSGDFMVEGDMEIPPGYDTGGDATMVVAFDPGTQEGYMLGMSLDNGPGNFYLQENNGAGNVTFPQSVANAAIGTNITAGVWYTAEALVTGTGPITIQAKIWKRGTTPPTSWQLTVVKNTTAGNPTCTDPGYQMGWQADGSSGDDYYSNLKYYTGIPVINGKLTDPVPTGVTYSGEVTTGAGGTVTGPGGPSTLVWNFPGTIYNLNGGVTWWGPVSCLGENAITNTSFIQSQGANAVTSNAVTAAIICSTPTPTPTATNTFTPTLTPTKTPTYTPTNTPTPSPTLTPTFSPTPTKTVTLTPSPTPTNTYTPTPSPTPTYTITLTITPTDTPTTPPSATVTPTFTFTNTLTPTLSPTPTPSPTDTFTLSPTFTFTNTHTPVPSATATFTPTVTLTPTATFTPTATWTPTATFTVTQTFTPTPTNTVAISVSINKTVNNPQPAAGDQVIYNIGLNIEPIAASAVTVTDTIPAGMTYISSSSVPAPQVLSLPTAGPTPGTGTLLVWTFPTLGPGSFNFPYTVQVNSLDTGGTILKNQAALSDLANPTPQVVQAPVTVAGIYTVKINVFNSAGEIVKTISITQYSIPIENVSLTTSNVIASLEDKINIIFQGTSIGVWDGTDNQGQPVSNGQYYIKIDNIDQMGNVTSVTQPAIVNRKIAQLTVSVFNSAGEEVRQLAVTEADAMVLADSVSLTNSVITPSYQGGQDNSTTISLSSGLSFVWDGKNNAGQIVSPGQYYLEIKSTDGQGGETQFTQSVAVLQSGDSLASISVYPNPMNPSVFGDLLTFKDPTGALSLSVRIYTLAGELVSMPPLVNAGSGAFTLNISKLASGLYIADIEMSNSTGGTQRQLTRVAILK